MRFVARPPQIHTLALALPFAVLALWLFAGFAYTLNSDHAWLIEAAKRLLDGQSMASAYFDPNPPLSVLLYVPAVLIERSGIMPAPYTYYAFTALIVAAAAGLLYTLLGRIGARRDLCIVAVFSFLCANTLLCASQQFYFGERDQFILIGLVLFMLYQYLLTRRGSAAIRAYDLPCMALAVTFILLKPPYLIFPAIMGLHRIYKTRAIKTAFLSADFYVGAAITGAYGLCLALFFKDYLHEILPLLRDIYLQASNPDALRITFLYAAILLCAALVALISGLPKPATVLTLALYALCALALALFYLQGKGIYYQLLPALGFFVMGAGVFFHAVCEKYTGQDRRTAPASLCILLALCFMLHSGATATTHQDFRQTPLMQTLSACAPQCAFFMFSKDMNIIHQLAYYSGAKHTSRYPVLWWLPGVLPNPDTPRAQKLFSSVVEDIKTGQPRYLIIITGQTIDGAAFDWIAQLTRTPEGRALMATYEKTGTLDDTMENYMGPQDSKTPTPLTFAIYEKNPQKS